MTRDAECFYGCFRCGTLGGAWYEIDGGVRSCCECGEPGILTLQQALDMLNDIYLKHNQEVVDLMEGGEEEYEISATDVEDKSDEQ